MKEKILISDVNVSYGRKQILHNLNLEIKEGMFGLLGRNGAGKSTLMKTLVGILPVKSGEISICGIPVKNKKEIRTMIGYLPQDFNFYPNMTIIETLEYLGILSGMPKSMLKRCMTDTLELVNLSDDKEKKIKSLSGGMKRRLGIAQAIMHDPKILIVDEPTAGLDPEERIRFRNLLADLSKEKIVLLSTHIVSDIEDTCNNLAVINEGRIIFDGEVQELISQAKGITYNVKVPREEFVTFKERYIVISQHDVGENNLEVKILNKGKPKDEFESCYPTIEAGYLNLLYNEKEVGI